MATQATLYIQLMVTIQILPFVLFFLQPFFDTAMQTLGVRWSGWFSSEHWQWVPRGISELSVGGSNLTSMGYRKRNVPPLFLSPPPSTQQSFTLWGGGRGPPRDPTFYPFICTFTWQKRDPFRISSIDKWCHLHVRTFERSTPFNCCKCSVF